MVGVHPGVLTPDERISAFWKETLLLAAKTPLDPVREPAKEWWHPYSTFEVSYLGWCGDIVRARLSLPIRPVKSPLPAIITAPGYSGWAHSVEPAECQRGYAILQIFPRDQGPSGLGTVGQPRPGSEQLLIGLSSPDEFYYRGAYVDMIRGVDFLGTCAEVDMQRVGAMGSSQGGALVLAAGSLDRRIKAVCAHVPYFCDMANNAQFKKRTHAICQRLDLFEYFDPAILAGRCLAPTLISSGGNDETCPANTIETVYRRLRGIKAIAHYPDLTHTTCGDFYAMGWEWMGRHL